MSQRLGDRNPVPSCHLFIESASNSAGMAIGTVHLDGIARMRLLMAGPQLYIGGTQINMIELAAELQTSYGYDVTIYARPGALSSVAESKGVDVIAAPITSDRSTKHRAISQVLDSVRPDLVQAWLWWAYRDAVSACVRRALPLLAIDMLSDRICRGLPRFMMTTFGTPELADIARKQGRRRVETLVPPVDTTENSPTASLPDGPVRLTNTRPGAFKVVTVSRVTDELKSDSLERTMRAVAHLASDLDVQFIVVGAGDALERFERIALEINGSIGREVVRMVGELLDPRPAYAMADVVVGMGGSALRGMAFAKPVVVVGEGGFTKLLSPETASYFLYHGLYGTCDGEPQGRELECVLSSLHGSSDRRAELGAFSRHFVEANFSIGSVTHQLDGYCRSAMERPTGHLLCLLDAYRAQAVKVGSSLRRRVSRVAGGSGHSSS